MAKPLRFRQMGLARAQFFLRPFALGDVDHGTHEFNQIAEWAENGMAHHVDVSNLPAGMNDSVIQLELRLLAPRCLGCFPKFGLIIRMDALKECFESRFSTVRVKTQHAVAFLGPVPNVPRSRDPCPTARMAQPLRGTLGTGPRNATACWVLTRTVENRDSKHSFNASIRMIKPNLGKQARQRCARRRSSSWITESSIPAARLESSTWWGILFSAHPAIWLNSWAP